MKLSTEENVKIKIVLEYLTSLGFSSDELSFEDSFSLNLGRSTYKVDTLEQCKRAQPRLDILVTRNQSSLFVVEVKSDLMDITEKDIKQGTSYARLVHPVAPFTVITNGNEFHLYDSLTRKEIENDQFEIKDNYKVELPAEYLYEALKHFIGYSKENFAIFFNQQVHEGMKTLLGSTSDPNKKYIPELHTTRDKLISAIQQFRESEKAVFALLGQSGNGKTCSLCNLALKCVDDGSPVFFYKSFDLVKGIFETISEDINWEFSSQHTEIEVFRKLESLFGTKPILILIDAIDEWEIANKEGTLDRFVSIISKKNMKLILSCKSNSWDQFLSYKGIPTRISQETYVQDSENINEDGYYLEPFSNKEFFDTVSKYRKFYGFTGHFESGVLDECKRSPFLLRVFFEVAQKYQLDHITFSSIEFFNEYYRLTLGKAGNEEVVDAILREMAKCLYNCNSDSIDIDSLREYIGLRVTETLPPELFAYNILDKVDAGVNQIVRFYFDKLRDYLIAFHVKKWHEVDTAIFEDDFRQIGTAGIKLEALSFFYQFADLDKKQIVDGELRRNAERYLDFYLKVINEHFPKLKSRFSPFTEGDIGFLSEILIPHGSLGFYGFRALTREGEERLKFIPVDKAFSKRRRDVLFLSGGKGLHATGSSNGFRQISIENEVIKNEISNQLFKIVEKGTLNEKNNRYLSVEKALGVYYVLLSGGQYTTARDRREHLTPMNISPINLDDIEQALRYEEALRYYRDMLVKEKREQGVIKETWHGSHISYSYSYSEGDRAWIKEKAYYAAKNRIELEVPTGDLGILRKNLLEAIDCLRTCGFNSIKEKWLPDKDATGTSGYLWDDYTPDTLDKYVLRTFKLFLEEYKILIEYNFPTLKENFKLYSSMPIKVYLQKDTDKSNAIAFFSAFICKNDESKNNEVVFCDKKKIEADWKEWCFLFDGKHYEVNHIKSFNINDFFGGYKTYADFKIPSELASLRNLVYSEIESDLKHMIDALFAFYNIKRG